MNSGIDVSDQQARALALDVSKSIIVQAPAGSGKTELLTERFLCLLAEVDEPEQVLAITFTRAATAEMRRRVLEKLDAASNAPDEIATSGRRAWLRSEERQWQLLQQPHRLNIKTIDSLCLNIAHRTPLLARLGGTLSPTENAAPLYRTAAERTLQRLGEPDQELNAALAAVLALRDNNLGECERLIGEMLAQRDQWGHLFLLSGDVDWAAVRARLELPFRRAIEAVLARAHALLTRDPQVAADLAELARYACRNGASSTLGLLADLDQVPAPSIELVDQWRCYSEFLLTDGALRKRVGQRHGFPVDEGRNSPARVLKRRMETLLKDLADKAGLREALCAVEDLPPPHYSQEQWDLLRQLFSVLRHAVAELKVVFAEQNVVDFVELALAAEMVLRAPADSPRSGPDDSGDIALALSENIRHLLVDEFQDTSRRQHQLLTALLRGWSGCDGRTCFLVGDPMQSIYIFRQAEVELFRQVSTRGLDCDGGTVEFETLKLSTNYRSKCGIVGPLNQMFPAIFGDSPGMSFVPAVARDTSGVADAVHIHPYLFRPSSGPSKQAERRLVREQEAEDVIRTVRGYQHRLNEARRVGGSFTIGILVSAKNHAALVAERLRAAQIPYRALDLEELGERQEIRDLTALARALAHPMDRVAWLSVLRAPWCGLSLRDLHELADNDLRTPPHLPIATLLETRLSLLAPEGRLRAKFVYDILTASIDERQSPLLSFSALLERTWRALGGPLCVDRTAYENVQTFFRMLDEMAADGATVLGDELDARLSKLFARPDPEAAERVGIQVMTIHKAKGLGFDVVIVPGLERPPGSGRPPLISWLQRSAAYGESGGPPVEDLETPDGSEMLVAPIGIKGAPIDPLYQWVRKQREQRETEERKRLFYVACTRARQDLHLFGAVSQNSKGKLTPGEENSLLATAWPGLREKFMAKLEPQLNDVLAFPAAPPAPQEADIDLAAAEETETPSLSVRRLPLATITAMLPETPSSPQPATATVNPPREDSQNYFERPEASRNSRALGTTVHALFERAALALERGEPFGRLQKDLGAWGAQASSLLRNNGVPLASIGPLADKAVAAVRETLSDPVGRWVLGPHKDADTETSWTGWLDGGLRTFRVDRTFRAGAEPLIDGDDFLWIVDYKTAAHEGGAGLEDFLAAERLKYEEQLAAYGKMLRLAHGSNVPLRLALYYPLLPKLIYSGA